MKPGNLRLQGAKSCGKPRYEGNGTLPYLGERFLFVPA